MRTADPARNAPALSSDGIPRLFIFFCVLIFAALLECWELSALGDPEIWGHLSAGTWILQNRAWPQSGLFSQAHELPWRDFSWGFAMVSASAYRIAGYAALPALLIVLRCALALCTFLLAGGWRNFWPAVVLSALAQYLLLAIGPGPAFLSVLLFACEAWILWDVRESGDDHALLALPALFLFWGNQDTGLVYGIALYLIFFLALLMEAWLPSKNPGLLDRAASGVAPLRAAWIGVACLAASCVNPYGFHPYFGFFANELSLVNHNLPNYNSMGFRQPQDYILMLLGMSSFLALGFTRSRDFFQIGALAGSAALTFHAQHEGWLLALTAVAVIGQATRQPEPGAVSAGPPQWNRLRVAVLAAAVILSLAAFFLGKGRNHDLLWSKVAEKSPVGAANFLRQHPQAAPFFNDYRWGSFLTWYLPEYPVAIDSRQGLYPEETEAGYFKVMNADISFREFPPMNQARTLLMDKAGIMGQALRGVAGFRVLYEDDLAIVYARETKE